MKILELQKTLFYVFLTSISLIVLVGCASSLLKGPGIDPASSTIISDDENVTIGITHAVLGKNILRNLSFWWHSTRVVGSLNQNSGFLGYQLKINVWAGEAWTMTVWKNEDSLNSFVQSPVHKAAMQNGYPALLRAEFVRATLPKSEVPNGGQEVINFVVAQREQENPQTGVYKEIFPGS